jgi:glycosyltransferase involved in cell wall biosynthesis
VACTFLGAGPLQAEVAARYPEHAAPGWAAPEAVRAATRGARAVVVPSRWPETACLAAAEPLANGTPVAMAQVICSAGELASSGGAVTFDGSDPAALEAVLRRIASADGWTSVLKSASSGAMASGYDADRRHYFERLEAILSGAQVKGCHPPPSAL